MTIQLITYRGRTVAAATRERFFLADAVERRPACDPARTFVIFMCTYAGDVLSGVLPGPTATRMRAATRACLAPRELLERAQLDVARAAQALQLPAAELRAARVEPLHGRGDHRLRRG